MSTYGEVKARIAREMHRSDLSDDIVTHMAEAIREYRGKRRKGGTTTQTFETTEDQAEVEIAGLRKVDRVGLVRESGEDVPLTRVSADDMAHMQGSNAEPAEPCHYAWEDDSFKLWPVPDDAYTLNVLGIFDEPALEDDGDENFWTNDGAALIVACTKKTLARDVTLDVERMNLSELAERKAWSVLADESNVEGGTGDIEAGW